MCTDLNAKDVNTNLNVTKNINANININVLKALTIDQLLSSAQSAVNKERLSTIEVLRHFREIERRRIHFAKGYSSLFEMAVGYFGYSRAGARRRINSMRLINEMPEAEQKIESGELSLTTAANVQSFFKEKSTLQSSEKRKVLETCLNKSSREVEKELASRSPKADKREAVRFTDQDWLRLSSNISEDLYEKLEILKHMYHFKKVEDVILKLATQTLSPIKSVSCSAASLNDVEERNINIPAQEPRTRYIPKATKRIVIRQNKVASNFAQRGKDQVPFEGRSVQCEYVNPLTYRRCAEKHNLQFDHIHPYSKGGPNLVENLRHLCSAHNRLVWKTEQQQI